MPENINKISVIIPNYNEEKYIIQTLKKVNEQKRFFNIEIIVCDDNSSDQSVNLLNLNKNLFDKLLINEKNYGKGYSVKKCILESTGNIILIQDADLEYDPKEYNNLIQPLLNKEADVVYGSRFIGHSARRLIYYKNKLANNFLTFLVNVLTNINFTDVETGYKVFKSSVIKKIRLEEDSFAFEIEVTMKISKMNIKIYEVGISYYGRTVEEGKKISFIDGMKAIYSIFKYKFFYN